MNDLATALDVHCPSGVGVEGQIRLSARQLEQVCREGSTWALKNNYALPQDIEHTEQQGRIQAANPSTVSSRAMQRGKNQLGTLGAGNHFIEVDVIERIFDESAARAMGLEAGCLTLQLHCGSRGFGHQICSDYVRQFQEAARK